ncbi:hypothetical protein MUK42_25398 [Musa troglodytarum]|uniref:Uncharacterized protein n=1 Tax=Musa troglodytarum TaxID=320322 RepID=A0A9E7H0B0_9LILI|nr:hypothetical protein MUK42_25398 [Musa troglodytarum]URE21514.1 hypothetical protein MUK42_25398 [Musa troglodytarum]URE21517.1 hypothetical protein MUK42_25398 [Musa troglodytarum]
MEPLLSNLTSHPDLTVHTEALGVISSLNQNNQAGIAAFYLANGYPVLGDVLRVLNLVQSLLLGENNSDCSIVVSSAHVREAAVGCHLEFAGDRTSGGSTVLAEEDKLKEVLQRRIEGISG